MVKTPSSNGNSSNDFGMANYVTDDKNMCVLNADGRDCTKPTYDKHFFADFSADLHHFT